MDLKEVKSVMPATMGQAVPKIKAIVSHDRKDDVGHIVQMTQAHDDTADIAWLEGFRERLKKSRGDRSQEDMADLLGITRDAYSKYEGSRGTVMPMRLVPRFCKICAVKIDWLIEGERSAKAAKVPARLPTSGKRRA